MTALAAPQPPAGKPALWRDLNVFVAAFIGFASLGGFALFVPVGLVLKLVLPAQRAEQLAFPLGYVLLALVLAYFWWKHGLSPRYPDPRSQNSFRWGHRLLAMANVLMVGMFALTSLGRPGFMSKIGIAGNFVMLLLTLAPIATVAGLVLVWSSRNKTPAFADTLPAGQVEGPTRGAPSAKWTPSTKPASGPSWLLVLFGLFVSSLMVYMGAVFAALGFQGNTEVYTGTVLPVVGFVYGVYTLTTIFLLFRRSSAANWFAWLPMILAFGMGTLVSAGQMVMSVVGR